MPPPAFHTYARKFQVAARRVDTAATPAQREAGNFAVGKVYCHGLELAVEYPRGSIRRGTGPDGRGWSRVMAAHYGRINRTTSPHDHDPVDFFMGDHPESQLVYVVSQLDGDGNLDEHKCLLGTRNVAEAKRMYLAHYPAGWAETRMGELRGYTMAQFKAWLASDNPVKRRAKRASPGCPGCDAPGCDAAGSGGCPAYAEATKAARVRGLVAAVRRATRNLGGDGLDGIAVQVHPATGRVWADLMDWADPEAGRTLVARLARLVGRRKLEVVNEGRRPDAHEAGWRKVAVGRPDLSGLLGSGPEPPAVTRPPVSGVASGLPPSSTFGPARGR